MIYEFFCGSSALNWPTKVRTFTQTGSRTNKFICIATIPITTHQYSFVTPKILSAFFSSQFFFFFSQKSFFFFSQKLHHNFLNPLFISRDYLRFFFFIESVDIFGQYISELTKNSFEMIQIKMQTSHFEAITSILSQNDTFDNRCIQKSINKKKKIITIIHAMNIERYGCDEALK